MRVAPKHMAGARRSVRERGKSDSIDAFSVARAALREGLETLPGAHLDGAALDIRLLSDHRDDLVKARTQDQQRLRWHLHDLWPEFEIPGGALDSAKWLGKISRRLARAEQTARVRVARDLVRQIAGAERFSSDAKLARTGGAAPTPPPRARPAATASIAAVTANSTARFTALLSTKGNWDPHTAAYLPASRPRASRAGGGSLPQAPPRPPRLEAPTYPASSRTAPRATATVTIPGTAPALMPCLT